MSGTISVTVTEETFAVQFTDAFAAGQALAHVIGLPLDRYTIEYIPANRESHWRPAWESDRSNGHLLDGAPEYLVLIDNWYDSKRSSSGQRHRLVPVGSWLVFPSEIGDQVKVMSPEQFKKRCTIVELEK